MVRSSARHFPDEKVADALSVATKKAPVDAASEIKRAAKLSRPMLQIAYLLPREDFPCRHVLTEDVGMENY